MEAGELTGFSITGIVKHSTCGVCGKDYVDCLHVGGETYDGVECVVHLHEIDLCELHVVGEPINPLARLAGGGGVRET
jgi:hypothetical protein